MKNVTVLFILFFSTSIYAQLIDVGLQSKIKNSNLIVEGEIIHQHCIKGNDGLTYTKSEISVSKLLKGSYLRDVPIYILTKGGEYNGKVESWSHSLTLSVKDRGVFFLQKHSDLESNSFNCFASSQGFYAFREHKNKMWAYSPLHSVSNIDKELYKAIENEVKTEM